MCWGGGSANRVWSLGGRHSQESLGKGRECGTEQHILGIEIDLIWLEGRV